MAAVTTYYNVTDSFTPRGQAWVLAQGVVSTIGRVVPTGWGDLYPALPASCQKLLPGSLTAKGSRLCIFGNAEQLSRHEVIGWHRIKRVAGTRLDRGRKRCRAVSSRQAGRPALGTRHDVLAIPADVGAGLSAIGHHQVERKHDAAQ